ncbi:MAG: SgcJ/EcaC family oxidoreductase [bacterium]|nr:SgcJ/EcaC family oxidoreductase [bacterium]
MGKDVSSDIKAIEAMSNARAKAFNEGDAKTIAAYFSEDAVLLAPGAEPKIGPKEVEAYYQSIFDQYETRLHSYYDEVEVSGDLAFGRGTAEVTLIPKNGDSTTASVSKYLNILQKQPNGEWKTTHDIWNDNQ